uniref:Ovule protein n=1 Tax=Steinernema glaseri TaxID=37863 RepID=A0A1I8A0X2_9BILA
MSAINTNIRTQIKTSGMSRSLRQASANPKPNASPKRIFYSKTSGTSPSLSCTFGCPRLLERHGTLGCRSSTHLQPEDAQQFKFFNADSRQLQDSKHSTRNI